MYEKFTDRKEGNGVALHTLKRLNIDVDKVKKEIETLLEGSSKSPSVMIKLPETPRAKKIIGYAIEEARSLNHNYVGTEHLLLGIIKEDVSIPGFVLKQAGVSLADAVKVVKEILGVGVVNQELSDTPNELSEKIKVRIPIGVTSKGEWFAIGASGISEDDAKEEAMYGGFADQIQIIEAEVAVPEKSTVKGETFVHGKGHTPNESGKCTRCLEQAYIRNVFLSDCPGEPPKGDEIQMEQ